MLAVEVRQARNGDTILEMRHLHFGSSTLAELERPRRMMDQVYTNLAMQALGFPPAAEVAEKLIRVKKDK
jgi:hypothetical protein